MRKILVLFYVILVTSFATVIYAQTNYDDLNNKVSLWLSDVEQDKGVREKAKNKTIKYPSLGYSIEVEVIKGDIFQGSDFKLYNSEKKLIVDGVINSIDSPITLKGRRIGSNGIELLGTFHISNTQDGQLELRPNKAEDIAISTSSVDYILSSDFSNPVIISINEKLLALNSQSSNCGFTCVTAHVSSIPVRDAMSIDIRSMLEAISGNATVYFKDKVFKGSVASVSSESKPVDFILGKGTCTFSDGKKVTIKKSGDNYVMTISGDTSINSGTETTYTAPIASISEDKLWSERDFIKQAESYQKQLEKGGASSNLSSASSKKTSTSSKAVNSSVPESSNDASGDDESGLITFLIIAAIILAPILYIHHLIHARDCPNCKKKHAMEDIDKQFMGTAYEKREQQSDGKYANVHHNKYKIVRRCRYCGYEDYKMTEEKG